MECNVRRIDRNGNVEHSRKEWNFEDLKAHVMKVTQDFLTRMTANPQELVPVVEAFIKQNRKLKTDQPLHQLKPDDVQ